MQRKISYRSVSALSPGIIRSFSLALLLLLALSITSLSTTGCRNDEEHKPLIGVVLKDNANPKFQDIEKGARKAATEGNAEILVLAPERRDAEKQAQLIRDLVDMKVNALCIAPEGPDGAIPAIAKASEKKIPVVLVESDIDRDKSNAAHAVITSVVTGNNFNDGVTAGRFLARKINGKGKVALMEGVPGSLTGKSKREGFLEAMKSHPEIQVIFTKPGYYKRSKGFEIGMDLLKSYEDLDGVFAFNDMMAIGVADALSIVGTGKKPIIIGFDGTEEGKRAVKEGRIDATFFNNPYQMGYLGVKYALAACKGGKVPPVTLTKTDFMTKEKLFLPFE